MNFIGPSGECAVFLVPTALANKACRKPECKSKIQCAFGLDKLNLNMTKIACEIIRKKIYIASDEITTLKILGWKNIGKRK